MQKIFITIIALLLFQELTAQEKSQKKHLTFDYQLVVDNDAFTFDLTQDQYYSSGIYGSIRILKDSISKAKVIQSFQLNHRMYTPKWIGWDRQDQLDRPYAGLLSASIANEYYFHSNQYLKAQLELGWLGPGALVGETQAKWHQWFGMPQPMGWKYQINNTPIINLHLTYIKPIYSSYNFELTSETNASGGTVYNNIRQELMVRVGELKPINKSAYVSSSLGNKRIKLPEPKISEIYFFYSPGLEYVFYNATLEGNFIGEKSIYTVDAIRWVFQHRGGVMLSWPRFDLGFIAYWRTQENETATRHNYVGIRLNQRF